MKKSIGESWVDVRFEQPVTDVIIREEIEKPGWLTWLAGPVIVATFGILALFFGLFQLCALVVYGLFRPKKALALGLELLEQYQDNDVRPWE